VGDQARARRAMAPAMAKATGPLVAAAPVTWAGAEEEVLLDGAWAVTVVAGSVVVGGGSVEVEIVGMLLVI